eukprot:TRINITY_DN17643_c0_g1_i2.p1 TRINITY_DN17643_c0_g1~~TRINITY_DN17643_c0_g1_i2.p1  ORF type:complete len:365 (-),score=65.45 TRINITY_DN17643_c0_g1_i2:234-1328(-)
MVWGNLQASSVAEDTEEKNGNGNEAKKEENSEFPSLHTAAATKTSKKGKKNQTKLTLSEFTTGVNVGPGSKSRISGAAAEPKGLTPEEMMMLPTGPRERSAEELERGRDGFRGYDVGREKFNSFSRRRENDEPSRADSVSRWSSAKSSGPPSHKEHFGFGDGFSKADEVENWSAGKKTSVPPPPEKKYGAGGGGGFFRDSTRADHSENWFADRRGGSIAADSASSKGSGLGFDSYKGDSNGDRWSRREENSHGERRRLVLQPRSVGGASPAETAWSKSGGNNPFGDARPREEVLAQKGQDWKKIDEEIDSRRSKDPHADKLSAEGDWRKKNSSRDAVNTENDHGCLKDNYVPPETSCGAEKIVE